MSRLNLSVVETPTDKSPALSKARQALADHLAAEQSLKDEAAGHRAAFARLEDDIRAPAAIERELATLAADDAKALEEWAATGTGDRPAGQMAARKDAETRLDAARRRAVDAEAALASLHKKEYACQVQLAQLEASKADLVRAVVLEEADAVANRVRLQLEQLLVDLLHLSSVDLIVSGDQAQGIRSPFPYDMRARLSDPANNVTLAGLISVMQFKLPSLAADAWSDDLQITPEAQRRLANRWSDLASSLFTDPTATISE